MIRQWYDWDQYGQLGGDPNQTFSKTMQTAIENPYPGLLGNVADDYTDVANYQAKYGPENVYASDIGTQFSLLGRDLGLISPEEGPLPLTLAEQEADKLAADDREAQMKAAAAAGKNFKAAMKAGASKKDEQMKMLSPLLRAASAPRPISAPGALNPYGGFRSLYSRRP